MVTITRVNLRRCKFEYSKNSEKRIIDEVFSVFVEGAIFSEKYKEKKWDGFCRFYDKQNYFDFGLLNELITHLKNSKIKYCYVNNYKNQIILDDIPISDEMREYQGESIVEFFDRNIGILVVPTRGGKTFITSETIRILREKKFEMKILYIVDTQDLLNQAAKDISDYLKIDINEIGKIGDGKMIIKDITIATAQTLTSKYYFNIRTEKRIKNDKGKWVKVKLTKDELKLQRSRKNKEKRELLKYLKTVTFSIIDEIHDQTSTKRINLFSKCSNVKLQLGLSATPYKQLDVIQAMKTKGFFGDECYRVTKKRLQKEGHLSIDKAILISHEMDVFVGENYRELLTNQIHENFKRNQIIENVIKICLKNRWKTLILFNSKKHGRLIAAKTKQRFICGDDSTDIRNIEKNRFLKGKGKILMASNIYKKGITLPQVEVILLADGGYEGTNIIQKIGRVLGTTKTKKNSIIIDILDVGSEYFSKHSLNRLEIYDKEIGKKRIEVYESDEFFEIESSIKEWLDVNK